jgi:hypothetical protein
VYAIVPSVGVLDAANLGAIGTMEKYGAAFQVPAMTDGIPVPDGAALPPLVTASFQF